MGSAEAVTAAEGRAVLSSVQISRLAGVSRAAVTNWRARHADFPDPVADVPGVLFDHAAVMDWLRDHGKLHGRLPDAGAELWRRVAMLPGGRVPGSTAADLLEYLRGEASPSDVISSELARCVDELASELGARPLANRIADRTGFELRHSPFTAYQRLGEVLASLVPEDLAAHDALTVLDPACGVGNLLEPVAARLGVRHAYLAMDPDPVMPRIAAARIRLLGSTTVDTAVRDWLTAVTGSDGARADIVVSGPPPTVRDWDDAGSVDDVRWVFGLPPRAEVELAWLQHCFAAVAPSGVCLLVLPAQAASRTTGRRIRAEILRRGVLAQVLALPSGLAEVHRTVSLHVWILRRPAAEGDPRPRETVRLVDASSSTGDELARVVDAERSGDRADARVTRDVPLIDLLDEEVNLDPARWVEPQAASTVAEMRATRDEVVEVLRVMGSGVPDVPGHLESIAPGAAGDRARTSSLTVAELARAGAVRFVTVGTVLEPDDIVIDTAAVGGTRMAQPAEVGRPSAVRGLRCVPEHLDPYFLLAHLRSSAKRSPASTGTTGTWSWTRRARVPRAPILEQRRLGGHVREALQFAEHGRRLAELASGLEGLVCESAARVSAGTARWEKSS